MTKNSIIVKLLIGNNNKLLSICIFLLRCTVGVILFVIGAGKVMGWFGGQGIEVTIQNFVTKAGIAAPLAYLSCYTEFIGGFLLILGLFTRPTAFAIMINMLVATIEMLPTGFFTGGAAYPFSLMISAIIILLAGPMTYSVDYLLLKKGEVINEV